MLLTNNQWIKLTTEWNPVDQPQGKYPARQSDETSTTVHQDAQRLLQVMDRSNHPQVHKLPGIEVMEPVLVEVIRS